ncbi:MAG: cytochrome bc complex cytochrome b subunit [Chloroflexi bacterium]|nr:cytochrome bc complex cytochrome b subunit [Chloroflexota bacterium]
MESNFDFGNAPFFKRAREAGLRTAIIEGADDVVTRVSAGINTAEWRAMLRGDQPLTRPNPRLKPHADGFWLHMRPGYYNKAITGLYPTFRLGWLSTYFAVFELITGLFLMVFYTPSTLVAYENMLTILSNVPLGQFFRDLHRLGAEAMVLLVALHMLRTYVTASYKKPRQFTWFTGVILLVFTLGLSFTGYLLPWDQLAYWAVTIGASMAEAAPPPVVGQFVNILMKGAPDLGAAGLLRFYLLHVLVFPVLLTIFTGVHYYKVVLHGHSLPPELEKTGEDTAKRVPVPVRRYFLPDIQASEVLWIGVVTLIMCVAVIFFYDAPLENHANPQSTPFHTVAPWYFLWAQGLLKLGDKTLMGVIIPTILAGAFMIMPYIDVGPVRHYGRRRFAISLSMLFITFIAVTSWMGTPAFLVQTSLDQEVFHEMAPIEKIGYAHQVPYEQYEELVTAPDGGYLGMQTLSVTGTITADDGTVEAPYWRDAIPSDAEELAHMLEVYEEEVRHAMEVDPQFGGLPNAVALLHIEQVQIDLVGLTFEISWGVDPNNPDFNNSRYVPIHHDAYPLGGRGH